ncbi:hypothetical protein, partial [Mycolicibacterium sp.]|uniref:hypothetical protein n=1 Tax=Mycolicibacterium sp. TaxID=2320850 RepID=UPI0037C9A0CF
MKGIAGSRFLLLFGYPIRWRHRHALVLPARQHDDLPGWTRRSDGLEEALGLVGVAHQQVLGLLVVVEHHLVVLA